MATVKKPIKYVYSFGGGKADGNESMKNLLGGKGANLAEMAGHPNLRLPVPPGFTLSTEVCTYYYDHKKTYPKVLNQQVQDALLKMEKITGKKFGDVKNPLLVSVRSGARRSMPGMMETVLNVGLNENTIKGIIEQSGDARFAYDAYRRLIMMYADVVMEKIFHLSFFTWGATDLVNKGNPRSDYLTALRKADAGDLREIRSTSCDLKSVGYKLVKKADANGKKYYTLLFIRK